MATITVRKVGDEAYERLKQHARENGRSAEAEVRHLIDERFGSVADMRRALTQEERAQTVAAFLKSVEEMHARSISTPGSLPDSTTMIREMRDAE